MLAVCVCAAVFAIFFIAMFTAVLTAIEHDRYAAGHAILTFDRVNRGMTFTVQSDRSINFHPDGYVFYLLSLSKIKGPDGWVQGSWKYEGVFKTGNAMTGMIIGSTNDGELTAYRIVCSRPGLQTVSEVNGRVDRVSVDNTMMFVPGDVLPGLPTVIACE